jgi:hypothetical protein
MCVLSGLLIDWGPTTMPCSSTTIYRTLIDKHRLVWLKVHADICFELHPFLFIPFYSYFSKLVNRGDMLATQP